MEYKEYDFKSVNKNNLSVLSLSQSVGLERRICELAELATITADEIVPLLNDNYSIYEIVEMLRNTAYEPNYALHKDVLEQNQKRIGAYLGSISSNDKGIFAQLLVNFLEEKKHEISELDFLPSEKGEETVTYVKNKLSDEAYDVFSQEMHDPRVLYSSSFRDAALAVANGKTRFCILPFEDAGGSRIFGIEQLIFKYDLKVNSITPVFGVDGTADMKYALVSKYFFVPEFSPDDDRYLEIKVMEGGGAELLDVITAAGAIGIEVYRVNTLRIDFGEGERSGFTLVLKKTGKEFVDMLAYLAFFCDSHTVIGIYKNLE